jgi:hypothetical protein
MRALLVLTLVGTVSASHAPRDGRLSIRVDPTALDVRGDTVRIAYTVTNASTSTRQLFMFTVDAPARALRVEKPPRTAESQMDTDTDFGRSVASWGFLKPLTPGKTSPSLAFSARGVPGVVKYWAAPFVAPGTEETADVPVHVAKHPGPGTTAADSGLTVGVVPFPANRSRAALLARLERLLGDACTRGWVDDQGICNSLRIAIQHDQTERRSSLSSRVSEENTSTILPTS